MRIGIFTDTYTPDINGVVSSVVTLQRGLEAEEFSACASGRQCDPHARGRAEKAVWLYAEHALSF